MTMMIAWSTLPQAMPTCLRDAVRARDAFMAIAAHELRNTLTSIVAQVGELTS